MVADDNLAAFGDGLALLQRVRLLVRLGRGSDRVHVVGDPRRVRRARPLSCLPGLHKALALHGNSDPRQFYV